MNSIVYASWVKWMKSLSMRRHRQVAGRVLLLFILVGLLVFAGCTSSSPPAGDDEQDTSGEVISPTVPDTIIRELPADPQYLNPVLSNDMNSTAIEALVFDSLIDIDGSADSNLIGRLAESWDISEDRKRIVFHLRTGVRWHDGELLTADDVKFTFDLAMDDNIPAIGLKSSVEPIESITVEDPHRISFQFTYPYSPALTSIGGVPIVPRHRLDKVGLAAETRRRGLDEAVTFLTSDFHRNPIGSGAYIFKEWRTTQQISLTRNENYWNRDAFPSIKNVIFKIIPSRPLAFNILRKGGLDVFRANVNQYQRFLRNPELRENFIAETFYVPTCYYVGWNVRPQNPFFADRRVRKAMTYALDRAAFIEKSQFGQGQVITGPFYFQSWAYDPSIEIIPYDLEKALALLSEAGWIDRDNDGILDKDGRMFQFTLMIPGSAPSFAQLASIFQANLKKVGIEVSITQFEWSVFLGRKRKGEFDALIGGWNMSIDPDQYSIWHSTQIEAGNNSIGFQHPEVDRLLEQGRRIFEREERQKIYWRIHRILHEEQPYTFVYAPKEQYILSKRIKNYTVSPFGLFGYYPGMLSWKLEEMSR